MTTLTEFDQVFEEMNAPEYPATCDQCGAEGTNASMGEHVCDESAVVRAGERYGFVVFTGRHKILDYYKPSGQQIATADGEAEARTIVRALNAANQHATLVEQRERLLEALREYVTDKCNCYQEQRCQNCETKELLTTIEPETEVKSNTSGEAGR